MHYSLSFHHILIRGAVVAGEMSIDEDALIGEALIRAYSMESQACVYPRIITDDSVLKLIPGAEITSRNYDLYFLRDFDGAICFNYLRFIKSEAIFKSLKKTMEALTADEKMFRDHGNLKEAQKVSWMINYLNAYVAALNAGKIHFSGIR